MISLKSLKPIFFRHKYILIFSFLMVFLILNFVSDNVYACDGCLSDDNKCIPYGARFDGMYCSFDNSFVTQKNELNSCENNFECKSNLCVESRCVNSNLLKRIFLWLKSLFFS